MTEKNKGKFGRINMGTKYGRRKELQVGEFCERKGFKWQRSPGSKGPHDIMIKRKNRYVIQVKSTRKRNISTSRLSKEGEKKLIREAKKKRAHPCLAVVCQNDVWILSVPEKKVLAKGKLKSLKYKYPDER